MKPAAVCLYSRAGQQDCGIIYRNVPSDNCVTSALTAAPAQPHTASCGRLLRLVADMNKVAHILYYCPLPPRQSGAVPGDLWALQER